MLFCRIFFIIDFKYIREIDIVKLWNDCYTVDNVENIQKRYDYVFIQTANKGL